MPSASTTSSSAAGVHVEPEPSQQPPEDEQVVEQAGIATRRSHAARRCARRRARAAPPAVAAHRVDVFLAPSARRRACRRWRRASSARGRAPPAPRPSRCVSDTPGTLYSSCVRSSCTSAVTCAARRADASGTRARTMASSFSKRGIVDPLIQAAALERVVDLAGAVRGEDDERRLGGAHGAELGNRDLELREQLQQVAFELLVGAIDLVDEQHRRPRPRRDRWPAAAGA